MLVIGLSSRILTKHITSISNVRDMSDVKPGRTKGLWQSCLHPTPAVPLPVPSHWAHALPGETPPPPVGRAALSPKAHPSMEQAYLGGLRDPNFTLHLWTRGSHTSCSCYWFVQLGIPKCFDPLRELNNELKKKFQEITHGSIISQCFNDVFNNVCTKKLFRTLEGERMKMF